MYLILGPVFWIGFMLLEPLGGTITTRGVLGATVWAAWYWATGVVPLGLTVFIPLIAIGILPNMEWSEVIQSLLHPNIMLLLAPALLVMTWVRWGLSRRIALHVLARMGGSVRKQTMAWLVLATVLSGLAANVVVAIALSPIMIELLKVMGYETSQSRKESRVAMHLIISMAIGASLGGFITPMAGGQAVIVWSVMQETLGYDIAFATWASRIILPTFFTLLMAGFILWFTAPVKDSADEQKKYQKLLSDLPPMSRPEWLSGIIFFTGVAMMFTEPLWSGYLPSTLNLSLVFTILLVVSIIIPANKGGSNKLLDEGAMKSFPIHAFMLWPVAMAFSQLITSSGAGDIVGPLLGNFWSMTPILGIAVVVVVSGLVAQVASDTGTAGIFAPIVVASTAAVSVDPIFWLFVMGFSANLSFTVPSATGTMAIPLCLEGKTSLYLPKYGFPIAMACLGVSWVFWYTVEIFDLTFWFLF